MNPLRVQRQDNLEPTFVGGPFEDRAKNRFNTVEIQGEMITWGIGAMARPGIKSFAAAFRGVKSFAAGFKPGTNSFAPPESPFGTKSGALARRFG